MCFPEDVLKDQVALTDENITGNGFLNKWWIDMEFFVE